MVNKKELEKIGLSKKLINKLLNILKENENVLETEFDDKLRETIEENYNQDSDVDFSDLPEIVQKLILNVALEFGPDLAKNIPEFWKYITNQEWNKAFNQLITLYLASLTGIGRVRVGSGG